MAKKVKEVKAEVVAAPKTRTVAEINAEYGNLCCNLGDKQIKAMGIKRDAEAKINNLNKEIEEITKKIEELGNELAQVQITQLKKAAA